MAFGEDSAALYAERPEWNDVTPLVQYEEANPAAPIFYSEECESVLLASRSSKSDVKR